jgi:hypothetical protein
LFKAFEFQCIAISSINFLPLAIFRRFFFLTTEQRLNGKHRFCNEIKFFFQIGTDTTKKCGTKNRDRKRKGQITVVKLKERT